jgi:secondary thiamine-phosphate synthase enzyme
MVPGCTDRRTRYHPAAMPVTATRLSLSTRGDADCLDITGDVAKAVSTSGVRNGLVHLFVTGSTAGLTTIEFEPGCVHDLGQLFERIAPRDADYKHHERWGDHNGHSHMRASLLGPHLAVPVVDGELTLGTWQQVILVDFDDRPRERTIVVQVLGE